MVLHNGSTIPSTREEKFSAPSAATSLENVKPESTTDTEPEPAAIREPELTPETWIAFEPDPTRSNQVHELATSLSL